MRAVFFDLDGVLLDSMDAWRRASEAAFAACGIRLTEALYSRCSGMDSGEAIAFVLAAHPSVEADASDIRARVEAHVAAALLRGIPLLPGVMPLLDELASRQVPLALVSTSPRRFIDLALQGLGLTRRFSVTLSSEEVGPGKPDPAVYRAAMAAMSVRTGDGVAVEDTLAGVRSAAGAGLAVVAVQPDPALRAVLAGHSVFAAPDLVTAGPRLLDMLARAERRSGRTR